MNQEIKDKIYALVNNIHDTAVNVGYYSDPQFRAEVAEKNAAAWQELKKYLDSI